MASLNYRCCQHMPLTTPANHNNISVKFMLFIAAAHNQKDPHTATETINSIYQYPTVQ